MRDRGGVFSVVASVDVGAAGEAHVRGEAATAMRAAIAFITPGLMCHADVVV